MNRSVLVPYHRLAMTKVTIYASKEGTSLRRPAFQSTEELDFHARHDQQIHGPL